jgi:hypothetical protein
MSIKKLILCLFAMAALAVTSNQSFAKSKKKGYHCEVKVDGKHKDLKKVKSRKACKKKKGKWVKDHDHGHSHDGGSDHSHDEDY